MKRIYELMPTDGRKSFYGKAKVVVDENGTETLYSYDTPIISRSTSGTFTRLYKDWSMTTGRHIQAFCGLNKKQFMEMECE